VRGVRKGRGMITNFSRHMAEERRKEAVLLNKFLCFDWRGQPSAKAAEKGKHFIVRVVRFPKRKKEGERSREERSKSEKTRSERSDCFDTGKRATARGANDSSRAQLGEEKENEGWRGELYSRRLGVEEGRKESVPGVFVGEGKEKEDHDTCDELAEGLALCRRPQFSFRKKKSGRKVLEQLPEQGREETKLMTSRVAELFHGYP